MTHVVTARCMDCRYTDCVTVCPAQCFYEVQEPAMVVIDPEACVDCGLCIPECPINAIYADSELPEHYSEWLDFAPELVAAGANIDAQKSALPSAVDLDAIHGREQRAGWPSVEPGGA